MARSFCCCAGDERAAQHQGVSPAGVVTRPAADPDEAGGSIKRQGGGIGWRDLKEHRRSTALPGTVHGSAQQKAASAPALHEGINGKGQDLRLIRNNPRQDKAPFLPPLPPGEGRGEGGGMHPPISLKALF